MAETRKRTSMSVPEMGRMLGLCKTESYWLIKKNYFIPSRRFDKP